MPFSPPDSPLSVPLPRHRIVLVRPQTPGNIGAVARIMANFGLRDLVIVAPRTDSRAAEARAMACSGLEILEAARTVTSLPEALEGAQWVCATTARLGVRRRALFSPRRAAAEAAARIPSAFVFGPEDTGLSAEELDVCHAVLSIPTAPEARSLNLAQAVAIVAYEVLTAPRQAAGPEVPAGLGRGRPEPPSYVVPATAEELDSALNHMGRMLEAVDFFRQTAPEHPLRELRQFLARAKPTHREVAMLRGICRKTLNALGHRGEFRPATPGKNKQPEATGDDPIPSG